MPKNYQEAFSSLSTPSNLTLVGNMMDEMMSNDGDWFKRHEGRKGAEDITKNAEDCKNLIKDYFLKYYEVENENPVEAYQQFIEKYNANTPEERATYFINFIKEMAEHPELEENDRNIYAEYLVSLENFANQCKNLLDQEELQNSAKKNGPKIKFQVRTPNSVLKQEETTLSHSTEVGVEIGTKNSYQSFNLLTTQYVESLKKAYKKIREEGWQDEKNLYHIEGILPAELTEKTVGNNKQYEATFNNAEKTKMTFTNKGAYLSNFNNIAFTAMVKTLLETYGTNFEFKLTNNFPPEHKNEAQKILEKEINLYQLRAQHSKENESSLTTPSPIKTGNMD